MKTRISRGSLRVYRSVNVAVEKRVFTRDSWKTYLSDNASVGNSSEAGSDECGLHFVGGLSKEVVVLCMCWMS